VPTIQSLRECHKLFRQLFCDLPLNIFQNYRHNSRLCLLVCSLATLTNATRGILAISDIAVFGFSRLCFVTEFHNSSNATTMQRIYRVGQIKRGPNTVSFVIVKHVLENFDNFPQVK